MQHTPIFCDNSNAVNLASSIKFITRTKTLTLLTFGINKKLPERIKVHHVNTEDQAADIFAKSLARPFLEKCKKKLGLVSSKEMWPIISFPPWLNVLYCAAGNCENLFHRFRLKTVSPHGSSQFRIQNRNVGLWRTREAKSRTRRQCIIHILEVVFTVVNRSSVQSICNRPNKSIAPLCTGCLLGKLHRWPYRPTSKKAGAVWEKFHMDIKGPMDVTSIENTSFWVDDYSGWLLLWEALKCYGDCAEQAWNQAGKRITCVRCDNAKEFLRSAFNEYLSTQHTVLQGIPDDTRELNGIGQRNMRTVWNMMGSIPQGSGLPKNLWTEAITASF